MWIRQLAWSALVLSVGCQDLRKMKDDEPNDMKDAGGERDPDSGDAAQSALGIRGRRVSRPRAGCTVFRAY